VRELAPPVADALTRGETLVGSDLVNGLGTPPPERPGPWQRLRRLLFGQPRDLGDSSLHRRLSLVALLAWVGLGADGLSSSSYGPEEAFRTLGPHTYLAVALAGVTALTVIVIAAAYSRLIEDFPRGGGGYVVASTLLGERIGVVSGCALLVDYVLTITVSIAAAGDALFSFMPLPWHPAKLATEVVVIVALVVLNIRGVRESVLVLAPVFAVFVVTHLVVIVGGIAGHAAQLPATVTAVKSGFSDGLATLGAAGMLLLFLHAYSLGGGTYTGIEAVSNGLPIMREPRVRTGRRTMTYMAASLAFTATGLLICYLLWQVSPVEGRTLNAVLLERMTSGIPMGAAFALVTILSEGALLVVAAQAGFIDGPRVLANMALDSWVPRHFAALSDRLTTANGIVLMGATSLAALLATRGSVRALVIMYSINVFLTFSLSMFAMARSWFRPGWSGGPWKRKWALFLVGLVLCVTILVVTVAEKLGEGGWITVSVTGGLTLLCFVIRRHYRRVGARLARLFAELEGAVRPTARREVPPLEPRKPTAVILVGGYTGLGIHTVLNALRMFPRHFSNLAFVSVGMLDSGAFKGDEAVEALKVQTEAELAKYLSLAHDGLGLPATARSAVGTDVVAEAERLCVELAHELPEAVFFAGRVIFGRERWYQHLLHNDTALLLQKRLQLRGAAMVIIPAKLA
jgi:amino acid transporter